MSHHPLITNILLSCVVIGSAAAIALDFQREESLDMRLAAIEEIESTGPIHEGWEYMVASLSDDSFAVESGRLGEQGWEVVTARRATDSIGTFSYEVIVKRRIVRRRIVR